MAAGVAGAVLAALIALPGGAALGQKRLGFRGGSFEPPRAAPDFALHAADGGELRLSRLRGKVVALGFGYSYCPDVCPTTLADLAQARERLGEARGRFQVLYATVDPERDTPARLAAYMRAFDPTFIGLTGAPAQLAEVRKAYGVSVQREVIPGSATAYLVHHTSHIFLIDAGGRLRVTLPFARSSTRPTTCPG